MKRVLFIRMNKERVYEMTLPLMIMGIYYSMKFVTYPKSRERLLKMESFYSAIDLRGYPSQYFENGNS